MNVRKCKLHRGVSVTEVLISATLVVCTIGLFAPLSVRIGRVWQSTRQYRLAFNELANQMELLTSLGTSRCEAALSALKVSSQIADSLPGSQLKGQVVDDQDGVRLILSLDWNRGSQSEPLTLVGWIKADPKLVEKETSL